MFFKEELGERAGVPKFVDEGAQGVGGQVQPAEEAERHPEERHPRPREGTRLQRAQLLLESPTILRHASGEKKISIFYGNSSPIIFQIFQFNIQFLYFFSFILNV